MSGPAVLFTAFEPSGDEHAAPCIAELLRRRPGLRVYATGGERMERAGATLLERTTERATMMLGSLGQVPTHLRRLKRLKAFLRETPVALHVPVDSPAANWSICDAVRGIRPEARIVHMVCPQVWAWASYRVHKLRRLTDHVMCLLPFEPAWLEKHGVRGTFVGHPVYSHAHEGHAEAAAGQGRASASPGASLPGGAVRLALLPGSRPKEIERNGPTMVEAFRRLRADHPGLVGAVGAIHAQAAQRMGEFARRAGLTEADLGALAMPVGRTPEVIEWCDLALAVSGTITLHVALRRKPMVAMYNANWLLWHTLGARVVSTRTFTLPNLIAEWRWGRRVITELTPHFGDPAPVERELRRLMDGPAEMERQRRELGELAEVFVGHDWARETADVVLGVLDRA